MNPALGSFNLFFSFKSNLRKTSTPAPSSQVKSTMHRQTAEHTRVSAHAYLITMWERSNQHAPNKEYTETFRFSTEVYGNGTIHRVLQMTVSRLIVGLSTSEGSRRPIDLSGFQGERRKWIWNYSVYTL